MHIYSKIGPRVEGKMTENGVKDVIKNMHKAEWGFGLLT